MSPEIEATYEDGVLKLDQPLPLKEHERVLVTVKPKTSRLQQLVGLLRWSGDPDVLRRIAEDPLPDDSES